MAKGNPKPVSRKGRPNKATASAREAIAAFVDGNAHRLVQWLDQVASGEVVKDGEIIPLKDGPNPAKAFDMFQSVVEYHVPKLARVEAVTGKAKPKAEVNIFLPDGTKYTPN